MPPPHLGASQPDLPAGLKKEPTALLLRCPPTIPHLQFQFPTCWMHPIFVLGIHRCTYTHTLAYKESIRRPKFHIFSRSFSVFLFLAQPNCHFPPIHYNVTHRKLPASHTNSLFLLTRSASDPLRRLFVDEALVLLTPYFSSIMLPCFETLPKPLWHTTGNAFSRSVFLCADFFFASKFLTFPPGVSTDRGEENGSCFYTFFYLSSKPLRNSVRFVVHLSRS